MTGEARLEPTEGGLEPASAGWFVESGTRGESGGVRYPVSELAQRHAAFVEVETTEPREAYARYPQWRRRPLSIAGLPWQ